MKSFSIHRVRNVLIAVGVIVLVGATYFVNSTLLRAPSVYAGTGDNLSGWAWSSNIGWISFNSTNEGSATSYGVDIDVTNRSSGGTGDITGEAWSSNIGWISFDRGTAGNPPSAPFNSGVGPIAQINWGTGKISGWARALSSGGGWDGWIKLAKDPADSGPAYGVNISGNKFSGYAFGGPVVGWIDFAPTINGVENGVEISEPTCVATSGYSTPGMIWGSCTPTVTCDQVTYLAGNTYTTAPGVAVGACTIGGVPTGGTTVVSCGNAATLVCPVISGPVSTSTKTHWWQF